MCLPLATGLAEEALTAGPRTTETDREATKHQPQQALVWVTNACSHNRRTTVSAAEFSLNHL